VRSQLRRFDTVVVVVAVVVAVVAVVAAAVAAVWRLSRRTECKPVLGVVVLLASRPRETKRRRTRTYSARG
jgi:hypothetical protein